MCHKTGYGSWVFLVRRLLLTGFVQSLEFCEKSWSLLSTFPELEKICKIEVKSWKNGKKSCFFLKLQQVVLKWKVFCVCEILFNLTCMSWKKLRSCRVFFFKLSIDHPFHNLESWKSNYCLEKVRRKSWILDKKSVRTPYVPEKESHAS